MGNSLSSVESFTIVKISLEIARNPIGRGNTTATRGTMENTTLKWK